MKNHFARLLLFSLFALPLNAQESHGIGGDALLFFDSKIFDGRLSRELAKGGNRVEIQVEGRVSLNQIPPRLDKWFSRVADTGTVELRLHEACMRSKSIISLASMIFSGYQSLQEEFTLRPAGDYNAIVYYRRDPSGESVIDRVVFLKR